MAEDIRYIKCHHGEKMPWSIVCVHLMEGTSKEWTPIPSGFAPEVEHDWVCPKCEENMDKPNLDDLKPICICCVEHLRAKFDENYEKEIN